MQYYGLLALAVAIHVIPLVFFPPDFASLTYGLVTLYGIGSMIVVAKWAQQLSTESRVEKVIKSASILAVLCAVILILYNSEIQSLELFFVFERFSGLFQDPNVFASFLLFPYYASVFQANRNRKWLYGIALLLGVVIGFTGSRVAMGCLILPLIPMCVKSWRRFLVVVGIVSCGLFFVAAERVRFQSYDVTRFQTQWDALLLAFDFPQGIGAGRAEEWLGMSPHQTYIRVFLEHGLLGFGVYVALLVFVFSYLIRPQTQWQKTLYYSILSLIIANFVVDTLHWRHGWIWLGLALAEGGTRHQTSFSNYAYGAHWWSATTRAPTRHRFRRRRTRRACFNGTKSSLYR